MIENELNPILLNADVWLFTSENDPKYRPLDTVPNRKMLCIFLCFLLPAIENAHNPLDDTDR